MRKITVLIMTLLMSLTLSTAAFAGQVVKEITFYGNAQQGSIGDGTRAIPGIIQMPIQRISCY